MALNLRKIWKRLGLPRFFTARDTPRVPPTRIVGRTGDARYVPTMASWTKDRSGKRYRVAHRLDDVSIRDYDRARFYPIVRDALRTLRAPIVRANAHFSCQRQDIADLCTQELGPLLPDLIDTLLRGATEFGWQVVEKRWIPKFNVSVSVGGQQGGEKSHRIYPFVWTISRFAAFSPADTVILVDPKTGDFAGVRQSRAPEADRDVPAAKCIHFVVEKEYDSNYGVPMTKPAIPFIEAAESVYDSMTLYSQLYASPYKLGRYPSGRIPQGDSFVSHADIMENLLDSLEAGHSIVLPSDTDERGHYRWDLQFLSAGGGGDNYVDKLNHLNDMIRIALTVPQYAASSTPETGTYNLGQAAINLFLQNAEQILDRLAYTLTKQLVADFVLYNFGPEAPPCRLYFEPLDQNIAKALLGALVQMLGTGDPMIDADGNLLFPDWGKIAQDRGVPLVQKTPPKKKPGMPPPGPGMPPAPPGMPTPGLLPDLPPPGPDDYDPLSHLFGSP